MTKKTTSSKTIQGVDAEEYFGTVIGPQAANILEILLFKFQQNILTDNTSTMTGAEMKLVQFAIERSYGAATRRSETVRLTDQDIAVDKLADVDPEILRRIAGGNAPRTDLN